jgi:hypothetical protein
LLSIDCLLDLDGKESIAVVDNQTNTPEQLARLYRATAAAEYLKYLREKSTSQDMASSSADDAFVPSVVPAPEPYHPSITEKITHTLGLVLSFKSFAVVFWILLLLLLSRIR